MTCYVNCGSGGGGSNGGGDGGGDCDYRYVGGFSEGDVGCNVGSWVLNFWW